MKAFVLRQFGAIENLKLEEINLEPVKEDEVLIRVNAISINPVDVKTRAGKGLSEKLQNENPLILGWDVSGVVTARGKSVRAFQLGDEVFGMANFPGHGKTYAEYVSVPESHLTHRPLGVPFVAAAAATLSALTAWQAMTVHATVNRGDRVLIHGASGGVGHFAVQMAKYLGARVIATSSAANRNFVLSLGADEHIDYRAVPFETVVSDIDFVLDTVGGDNIDRSLEVIKPGGTIVSIPSGLNEQVAAKAREKNIKGINFLVESNGAHMKQIADLLTKGIVQARIDSIFPFEELPLAHRKVESGKTAGKIIVKI